MTFYDKGSYVGYSIAKNKLPNIHATADEKQWNPQDTFKAMWQ